MDLRCLILSILCWKGGFHVEADYFKSVLDDVNFPRLSKFSEMGRPSKACRGGCKTGGQIGGRGSGTGVGAA